MDNNNGVSEVLTDTITGTNAVKNQKELSLDALVLLLTTDRINKLDQNSRKELVELRSRQKKVAFLQKLNKTINAATGPKNDLDTTNYPDLQKMLLEGKKLGVEIDETKALFNSDERQSLKDNIKMTIDELNVENEMQLQLVTQLTNLRYEAYQMARSILKPLHDAKQSIARFAGK